MLKTSIRLTPDVSALPLRLAAQAGATGQCEDNEGRRPPVATTLRSTTISTRFGAWIDVRNRGALRLARLVGIQVPQRAAPAVVRLWSGDSCRELSSGEARALALQLQQAADHADAQNRGEL